MCVLCPFAGVYVFFVCAYSSKLCVKEVNHCVRMYSRVCVRGGRGGMLEKQDGERCFIGLYSECLPCIFCHLLEDNLAIDS